MLAALFMFSREQHRQTVLLYGLLSDASLVVMSGRLGPYASFNDYLDHLAAVNLACIYLPSLFLILRRPNVGDVPAWLDTIVAHIGVRPRSVVRVHPPDEPA
jgi:hypothetical protein